MPSESSSQHVAIALALVFGGGATTAVGAAVVFVPSLVQYANRKTLASALGLSAGVMTYVSFVEIFRKSVNSFRLVDGCTEDDANVSATMCFFGGVLLMAILNYYVAKLVHGVRRRRSPHDSGSGETEEVSRDKSYRSIHEYLRATTEWDDLIMACCSDKPIEDLEAIKVMALNLEKDHRKDKQAKRQAPRKRCNDEVCSDDDCEFGNQDNVQCKQDEVKLMRMSVATAIAIALHNFPEGLATFVAALHDPKIGAVLALAIAIHNVPEGLCVALPIYYATGSRWKGFLLALCSGASEPLAALLGWLLLAHAFDDTVFAILFGIVAGMMVTISIRELLPTAHRYDPQDSVVTSSFIVGMCVMALSLVLFLL